MQETIEQAFAASYHPVMDLKVLSGATQGKIADADTRSPIE